MIYQGNLYWVMLDPSDKVAHPYLVLQEDVFNHSRITTVVVCPLTTNLGRVTLPGNVLLDAEEGGLPRQSVVEVMKLVSVPKTQLGDYIGRLSPDRVAQVLAGLRFAQRFVPMDGEGYT